MILNIGIEYKYLFFKTGIYTQGNIEI